MPVNADSVPLTGGVTTAAFVNETVPKVRWLETSTLTGVLNGVGSEMAGTKVAMYLAISPSSFNVNACTSDWSSITGCTERT